jgi:gliding motility-associated lipoprotein GldD
MQRIITALLCILFIASCRPPVFPPKPPGYFRIDTPASHQYQIFDSPGFPYTFEYPVYCMLEGDTMFKADKIDTRFWININFPSLSAMINITYKPVTAKETIAFLMDKADTLSFFHHEKADYIDETEFRSGSNVSGIIYNLGGNTASKYQFVATDSTKNFIRGALYFNVTPNADSLKPASDFIRQDIEHLLRTLKWRNNPEPLKGLIR